MTVAPPKAAAQWQIVANILADPTNERKRTIRTGNAMYEKKACRRPPPLFQAHCGAVACALSPLQRARSLRAQRGSAVGATRALTVALLTSAGACDCGCPVGWDGCGMVRSATALVLTATAAGVGVTKPGGSLTTTPAATVGSAPFRLNGQCRKRCAAWSLVQHAMCRRIMRHAAYRMPRSVQQHAAKSCIRHHTARST